MGVFLQTALFPGCAESIAREAVETAAKNSAFQIDPKTCRYAQSYEGTQVLMEGDCLGFAALARALSDLSENPVMLLYIYDGDFWGYDFYGGKEEDHFRTRPDAFGPVGPQEKQRLSGNPAALSGWLPTWDTEMMRRYLVHWSDLDEEAMEETACPGDQFPYGDCWQMTDFMARLGVPWAFDQVREAPPLQPSYPKLREILEQEKKKVRVTDKTLEKYLGKTVYEFQGRNEKDEVGIVRGLAWTSVGGDTLEIEVNLMPGKGNLELTGQMGDVMQESARAGISYIRSISPEYGLEKDYFQEHDIHIHIPEGAVPKDGPSAGITMATAMLSAVLEKPVRADVAMTGEITLRGRVLPIGGLKEKLLAAGSAGMKTVIVPKKNKRDVEELSKEITGSLELVYAEAMEEVIAHAFV